MTRRDRSPISALFHGKNTMYALSAEGRGRAAGAVPGGAPDAQDIKSAPAAPSAKGPSATRPGPDQGFISKL